MRKLLPTLIVVALITMASYLAFTFEIPEISVYQVFQESDQQLIQAQSQSEQTLETTLEELQSSVKTLITVGQTYDKKEDVSDLFSTYQMQYEQLNHYVETVMSDISTSAENIDFKTVERQMNKLDPQLQQYAKDLMQMQSNRMMKLSELNQELQKLVDDLESFNDMFYHSKTSDAVQYFQLIRTRFSDIKAMHTDYMKSVESYYTTKASYYEQIANHNVFDYLF